MEKTTSQGSTTSLDVLDASSPSKKGSVKKKKPGGAPNAKQLKLAKQKGHSSHPCLKVCRQNYGEEKRGTNQAPAHDG